MVNKYTRVVPVNLNIEVNIPKCSRNIVGVTSGLAFQTSKGVEVYIDHCGEEEFLRMLLYTINKNGKKIKVEGCSGIDGANPCIFYRGKES